MLSSVRVQSLNVIFTDKRNGHTIFMERVAEIQPLAVHSLQDGVVFPDVCGATAINFRSSRSKPFNAGSSGNSSNSFSESSTGVIGTKSHRLSLFASRSHRRKLSPAPGSPLERRFRRYSPRIIHLLSRTSFSSPRTIPSSLLIQVSTQLGEACNDSPLATTATFVSTTTIIPSLSAGSFRLSSFPPSRPCHRQRSFEANSGCCRIHQRQAVQLQMCLH